MSLRRYRPAVLSPAESSFFARADGRDALIRCGREPQKKGVTRGLESTPGRLIGRESKRVRVNADKNPTGCGK